MNAAAKLPRFAAALLLASAAFAGDGATEHFFTIEIAEGRVAAQPSPARISPRQTVVVVLHNQGRDEASIRIRAVDALTGESVGSVDAQAKTPGTVSVMAIPLKLGEPRHVQFQPEGVPLRAKVSIQFQVVDGAPSVEAFSKSWGRTYDLGASEKLTRLAAAPEFLTEAHDLAAVVFNSGAHAQRVTVYGWDYVSKQAVAGETKIVEAGRGARFAMPSELVSALSPVFAGGVANGLVGLIFEVEPLGGPSELTATVEAQSAFGNVTLKRGYIAD